MSSNYLKSLQAVLSGVSQRQAATKNGVSRNTVALLAKYAQDKGWQVPEDLADVTEQDLKLVVQGNYSSSSDDQGYAMPDYEAVHAELAKAHVTLKLLWQEYVEEHVASGERYYMETQFRHYYHDFVQKKKATIRLVHKPGMAMQVDWAGTKIGYYDEETATMSEASLFVSVLPCSQLMYAEVFRDEKLPSWIMAHVHAFQYLGGVPKTLVPDNLKTGVHKPNFYEPSLNRSYEEMANFYGTVILPSRTYKPQDKAAVENSVKITSNQVFGGLRNRKFSSFTELHEAVFDVLEKINNRPLTGKSVSRWTAFKDEEKDYLLTLPHESFELSLWSQAKVQPNCHIVYQSHYYSVPFQYLGETVDIRATLRTIEIFYHQQRIASHRRSFGKQEYTTLAEHMPPGKLFFADWDSDRFVNWAAKIGPCCKKVVQLVLDRAVIEQQAYRTCFGILGLSDKHSSQRVEHACQLLLQRTRAPRLQHLKQILAQQEDLQMADATKEQTSSDKRGFRRGAHYFADDRRMEK